MGDNDRYVEAADLRMVPALLHAYSIARNTAMMCGEPALKAEFQARIDRLCEQVGVPGLHHHVDDGGFLRACDALAKAREWFWFTRSASWSRSGGEVLLVVDGRPIEVGHRLTTACPALDAVKALVERGCHVEAIRLPDVEDWRDYDPARHPDEARRLAAPSPLP